MKLPNLFIPVLCSTANLNGIWTPYPPVPDGPVFTVVNDKITLHFRKTVIDAKLNKKSHYRYLCHSPQLKSYGLNVDLRHTRKYLIVKTQGIEFTIEPCMENMNLMFVTWYLGNEQGTFRIQKGLKDIDS